MILESSCTSINTTDTIAVKLDKWTTSEKLKVEAIVKDNTVTLLHAGKDSICTIF